MNHIESAIKVYFTRDYTIFNSLKGNRMLSEIKIKKIIKEIKSGLDMLKYYPIIVDDNMNVIDGQHRLQVARMLKSNIWYVIRNEKISLRDIASVNSNTEKWKAKDFLQCYISQGSSDYIYLKGYMDRTGFNLSTCGQLLYGGVVGGGGFGSDSFTAGTFKVKKADFAEAFAKKAKLFSDFKSHTDRGFLAALLKIDADKKITIEELANKFKQYPELLEKRGSKKEYLRSFEELFNHRLRSRVVIFN